jgi:hypothetical protein
LTPAEQAEADAEAEAAGTSGIEADGALAYDQAGDDGWSHDSLQEPEAEPGVAPVYDEAPAPPVEPPFEEESFDEGPYEAQPAQAPVAEEHEPAPPAMGAIGPETAEYNVEDVLAAEDDAQGSDDDDVLEETPEFLQDTPDHDRLWFEQRPPKDFDFDE